MNTFFGVLFFCMSTEGKFDLPTAIKESIIIFAITV